MLQLFEIPLEIEKSEFFVGNINGFFFNYCKKRFFLLKITEIPFYLVDQPMNGTTFLRVKFDLSGLDDNLRRYLDLFSM